MATALNLSINMLSTRFISSYNRIDKKLRTLFNIKTNATFSDAVRRAASQSALIRKYEDDLLDYARLRNAIVHNSDTDMVIAEPHATVVENIEHIERLLLRPPLAVATVAKPAVTVPGDALLYDVIHLMVREHYSNVPVVTDGEIAGVINNKLLVESIASATGSVDEYLKTTTATDILNDVTNHYKIMSDKATVEETLYEFTANRKLQIIIFTPGGSYTAKIRGIVTTGDLIDLNRIMEEY